MIACGPNSNDIIIDTVKKVEVNEFKFNTFKINYDDYKKNTEEFMYDYYNKDNETFLAYAGKEYKGKDLVGMPLDKYKELGDQRLIQFFGSTEIKGGSVEISKIYYDEEEKDKIKYVFTKVSIVIGTSATTIYKKYTFLNEDNVWKISFIDYISKNDYELDEKLLRAYKNYNNEPVEYIETLDWPELK